MNFSNKNDKPLLPIIQKKSSLSLSSKDEDNNSGLSIKLDKPLPSLFEKDKLPSLFEKDKFPTPQENKPIPNNLANQPIVTEADFEAHRIRVQEAFDRVTQLEKELFRQKAEHGAFKVETLRESTLAHRKLFDVSSENLWRLKSEELRRMTQPPQWKINK